MFWEYLPKYAFKVFVKVINIPLIQLNFEWLAVDHQSSSYDYDSMLTLYQEQKRQLSRGAAFLRALRPREPVYLMIRKSILIQESLTVWHNGEQRLYSLKCRYVRAHMRGLIVTVHTLALLVLRSSYKLIFPGGMKPWDGTDTTSLKTGNEKRIFYRYFPEFVVRNLVSFKTSTHNFFLFLLLVSYLLKLLAKGFIVEFTDFWWDASVVFNIFLHLCIVQIEKKSLKYTNSTRTYKVRWINCILRTVKMKNMYLVSSKNKSVAIGASENWFWHWKKHHRNETLFYRISLKN